MNIKDRLLAASGQSPEVCNVCIDAFVHIEAQERRIAELESVMRQITFQGGIGAVIIATKALAGQIAAPADAIDDGTVSLDAATKIMGLVYGPMPTGGSVQLKALVQCVVVDAIAAMKAAK